MRAIRRVAIVTGHFPPSNLAGVHRARLWAQYLREFGWEPIIVTAHWKHYEEALDWDLAALVPPELRVIRTGAFSTHPVRLVGDIGARALLPMCRALAGLARRREIDFVMITIPSNFCALLGRPLHRFYGVGYGIDYQDPWVMRTTKAVGVGLKARLSQRLAQWLEPWALRHATLLTAISPAYFEDVFARNPSLSGTVVKATMPIGGSEADFAEVRRAQRAAFLFEPSDGCFHMLYAGAMLPLGYPLLKRLLQAIARVTMDASGPMTRLRLHFVGTGRTPGDSLGHNVRPYIEQFDVGRYVDEHPRRIGYLDVLNHLIAADAVLVLGSTEAHYSPSKLFQAVLSRRPVLAILHEASSAVRMLREGNAGTLVTFREGELPSVEAVVGGLRRIVAGDHPRPEHIRWDAFEAYSARTSARQLAKALDEAQLPRVAAARIACNDG